MAAHQPLILDSDSDSTREHGSNHTEQTYSRGHTLLCVRFRSALKMGVVSGPCHFKLISDVVACSSDAKSAAKSNYVRVTLRADG